jgi:uncharacterized protein
MQLGGNRLGTMTLGPKTLVMDRDNGKWAMLPTAAAPLLDLIPVDEDLLPEDVRRRRASLIEKLSGAGVGGPRHTPPGHLTTVILKITKVCNYRCRYCYDMEPDDNLVHLPYEIAISSIEEALRIVPRRVERPDKPDLAIILHGGEPTLFFPLIKRLVLESEQIAADLGKKILFAGQTNASRINQDMVDFSSEHGLSWGISMDGPAAFNDRFRVFANGEGAYRDFERAYREYPEFVKGCGILTTVTANNQDHLLTIARHFRDLGMAAWDWSLFQAIGMARCQEDLFGFSIDRVVAAWNQLFDAIESGEFDGFPMKPFTDYLHNFILGPGSNMCMRKDCGAARDLLSVSADGSIEACDCVDRKGPLGNLGLVQIGASDSLRRALASPKAELIRSRDVETGQCSECIWLSVCGGTCMAHAGSVNGIWDAQCRLAMNGFERIASSIAQSGRLRRYWNSLYSKSGNADALAPFRNTPNPALSVN